MIRVALTGGGTGGHVFPLLPVADKLFELGRGEIALTYLGPRSPYLEEFAKRDIAVRAIASSKLRRYAALQNFVDIPKFFVGLAQALVKLYFLMPDVVFSKGGPGALAVVAAARFYLIPVIIHESDAVPGLTNRISGKLAARIAISFTRAARHFGKGKTALVGNPVRGDLLTGALDARAAKQSLGFDPDAPLLLVLGGSQGAAPLNALVLDGLGVFLSEVQVLHQAGTANIEEVKSVSALTLMGVGERTAARYRTAGFLETHELHAALAAADVVLSRAGASAIYEIAAFGKPSLLVPLAHGANDHQKENAYEYAEDGAAVVIEEKNLTPNLVLSQVKEIVSDEGRRDAMSRAAKAFFKPQAAEIIAKEILALAPK